MSGQRKCVFTHRPILPKERDSVQLYLAVLNANGRISGKAKILDICGNVRKTGNCDYMLYENEIN